MVLSRVPDFKHFLYKDLRTLKQVLVLVQEMVVKRFRVLISSLGLVLYRVPDFKHFL